MNSVFGSGAPDAVRAVAFISVSRGCCRCPARASGRPWMQKIEQKAWASAATRIVAAASACEHACRQAVHQEKGIHARSFEGPSKRGIEVRLRLLDLYGEGHAEQPDQNHQIGEGLDDQAFGTREQREVRRHEEQRSQQVRREQGMARSSSSRARVPLCVLRKKRMMATETSACTARIPMTAKADIQEKTTV